MSFDLTMLTDDDMSTLVQVMAWCRQATSHYLSQCWPRSLSPYGVTRPQWVQAWMSNYIPQFYMDVITMSMSSRFNTVTHLYRHGVLHPRMQTKFPFTGTLIIQRKKNMAHSFTRQCRGILWPCRKIELKVHWSQWYLTCRKIELQVHWSQGCIDGLVKDCSISIANALETLQSCTKPSI